MIEPCCNLDWLIGKLEQLSEWAITFHKLQPKKIRQSERLLRKDS